MTLTRRHMIALCAGAMSLKANAASTPLVFAAASLKTVLDEIAHSVPMRLNYAGSGVLARQISLGAPADIFISANPKWMQAISANLAASATPLLSNRLVLIAPKGTVPTDPAALIGQGRIAMGLTQAVPAGQYAKAAFQTLGIWDQITAQTVQVENVRAALALVSRKEVPWGVVYKTDAMADASVSIVAEFGEGTHPQIIYEAAVIKGSGATLTALKNAKPTFAKHGFIPL